MSHYFRNLCAIVCENSTTDNFNDATKEWIVLDTVESEYYNKCICGKEEIRFLNTIQNRITSAVLFPIGSECIKRFNNETMQNTVKSNIKLRKMKDKKMIVGKYKGLTYEEICANHPSYVQFLLKTPTRLKSYDNLIGYYLFGRQPK